MSSSNPQFFARRRRLTSSSPRHFTVTESDTPLDDDFTGIVVEDREDGHHKDGVTSMGSSNRKDPTAQASVCSGAGSVTSATSPLASIAEEDVPPLRLLTDAVTSRSFDPRGNRGLARLPVEKPYPCLTNFLEHKFDAYHVSFLRAIVTQKGGGLLWFMWDLLPQVVVMVALILLIEYLDTAYPHWFKVTPDIQRIHSFMGSILAFVLVFRSNGAYDRYYEGRKTLGVLLNQTRELMVEIYAIAPKEQEDLTVYKRCREHIRRKINILFAFIRQHIRESQVGFVPCSVQAKVGFFDEPMTYTNDPSRPRFCDLLTQKEAEIYSEVKSSSRAACVAAEIKGIVQFMFKHVEFPLALWTKTGACLQGCLDAQETLYRITTTPVPFPYSYITSAMCNIFVFATPFLYTTGLAEKLLGCVFLVFAYYGIVTMSHQLENPFGWDIFDQDVERFTIWTHEESLDIAYFCSGNRRTYIPKELLE